MDKSEHRCATEKSPFIEAICINRWIAATLATAHARARRDDDKMPIMIDERTEGGFNAAKLTEEEERIIAAEPAYSLLGHTGRNVHDWVIGIAGRIVWDVGMFLTMNSIAHNIEGTSQPVATGKTVKVVSERSGKLVGVHRPRWESLANPNIEREVKALLKSKYPRYLDADVQKTEACLLREERLIWIQPAQPEPAVRTPALEIATKATDGNPGRKKGSHPKSKIKSKVTATYIRFCKKMKHTTAASKTNKKHKTDYEFATLRRWRCAQLNGK